MNEFRLVTRLFSDHYLSKWCKYEAHCDKKEVERTLMLWLAKFAFLSWLPNLPEEDFGTILANYPEDYVGDQGNEGYNTIFRAVLGDDWMKHFSKEYEYELSAWPHPFYVMQHFVKNTIFYLPLVNNNNTMPRNVTNMAKLLIYPSVVQAFAKLENTSVIDIVKRELDIYPYMLKDNLTVRDFRFFLKSDKKYASLFVGTKF